MTDPSSTHTQEPVLIIEPGRTEKNYWVDLWRYRELFLILAWRDISVRYKQTIIGILWAILRPLLTMAVFTVIFGRIAKLPSEGSAPYALMVFAAMLPWSLFSNALTESSNSLISNANLIGKVYFPRLIIPAATLVTAFIDFLISFIILIGIMLAILSIRTGPADAVAAVLHHPGLVGQPGPRSLDYCAECEIPGFPLCHPICRAVRSLCFSGRIQQQDCSGAMATALQSQSDGGVIDGFRWCILGGESPIYVPGFMLSLAIITFFLYLGVSRFRKTEKTFADLI